MTCGAILQLTAAFRSTQSEFKRALVLYVGDIAIMFPWLAGEEEALDAIALVFLIVTFTLSVVSEFSSSQSGAPRVIPPQSLGSEVKG